MGTSSARVVRPVNTIRVIVEQDAKQDIREARDYYADKGENTSTDFRDEVVGTFDLLLNLHYSGGRSMNQP